MINDCKIPNLLLWKFKANALQSFHSYLSKVQFRILPNDKTFPYQFPPLSTTSYQNCEENSNDKNQNSASFVF